MLHLRGLIFGVAADLPGGCTLTGALKGGGADHVDGKRAVLFDGPCQIVPGRLCHLVAQVLRWHEKGVSPENARLRRPEDS